MILWVIWCYIKKCWRNCKKLQGIARNIWRPDANIQSDCQWLSFSGQNFKSWNRLLLQLSWISKEVTILPAANKCKGWFWKQRETQRKYETCFVFSVSVSSFWEPIRTISWFSCNIGYKAAFYGMGPNFIFSSVVKKETTIV